MATLIMQLNTNRPTAELVTQFETAGGNHSIIQRAVNYLSSFNVGNELGNQTAATAPSLALSIQENAVQASGTIIFSAAGQANDTLIINGVTFTAVASGATGNQWNVGGTATLSAAAVAASINASATALLSGYLTASAATGTVTITSAFYGISGNQTTIAKGTDAGSVMTVSGARLTAGAADATAQTISL